MRALWLVPLALLAAALPAQARRPSSNETRAIALINESTRSIGRDPDCNQRPPEATLTHDAPSQGLLDLLGILRRPPTPEDSPGERIRMVPAAGVYVDYVRVAHTADGRSYWIVPARDVLHFNPMPHSCLHRVHAHLREASRGQPVRVRRRALHFYNQLVRNNRRLGRQPPREGVFVFERRADGSGGGGGGGVSLTFLREHGMFGTSGTSDAKSVVNGLIPDGVATVTSTYGATERTDPVQDNMVSFEVERPAQNAFPDKMVWRDSGGGPVRVVDDRR